MCKFIDLKYFRYLVFGNWMIHGHINGYEDYTEYFVSEMHNVLFVNKGQYNMKQLGLKK